MMTAVSFNEYRHEIGEDSDDDFDWSLQAFVRPDDIEDKNPSLPPMDGVQYLRRVLEEYKKCEAVPVADLGDKATQVKYKLRDMSGRKECSADWLPDKNWQVSTMSDFSRLRQEMDTLRQDDKLNTTLIALRRTLPSSENKEDWLKIILQVQEPDVVKGSVRPSTKLCLALAQTKLRCLLKHFNDWLREDLEVTVGCRWMYCLLACLELPVDGEVYFSLRQLARALIDCRAKLETPDVEKLAHINLLICVIGRYFFQTDLADPY